MPLALLSVQALSQNQKEEAYRLANLAIAADPNSAAAYSALSYAQQSRFQLDKALLAADQAVSKAPEDALSWARKAELQLSMGQIAEAQTAAAKAFELDPELERTQTVLGFNFLLNANIPAAIQSFKNAVRLDSASPLARLGLGLAKIRDGNLAEGRQDIEIAVGLDPSNAMLSSYLGKAYYEELRKDQAQDQLDLAKQRDPKDPTAYFYDAILKLTTNRPVLALQNINKAIELNDNRAVYRSNLALDKDLAARSAAQARIYNELGFQQQGLLQGWLSLDKDSSNYSAHRLLADEYAALPRHEIARVSELLQSQLSQPLNITPIQPNLEETNLFVLNSLGPANLGFNEYNPLFEYNRMALQASGIYGGNNTLGDNLQLSGIHNDLSFSLGQFNYGTDGFRPNNYFRQNLYNSFLQYKVSERLNVQFEYRHLEANNGDLGLNFDLNNFDNTYKQQTDQDSFRGGGRFEFSPKSSLIGSLIHEGIHISQNYSRTFTPFNNINITDSFTNNRTFSGFNGELQHNYTDEHLSSISGFGHIDQQISKTIIEQDSTQIFGILNNSPPSTSLYPNYNLYRTNFYNYSKIYLPNKLTVTLGLSVDDYHYTFQPQLTPVNPKLGLVWNPYNSTTLRAAFFRVLSVTVNANQTIEPTQVAGFNQFYDDIIGTIAWKAGVGLDHRFSEQFAGGLEYSKRNLDAPSSKLIYRSEGYARAYLNYVPQDWMAVGLEYFYEKINQLGLSSIANDSLYATDLGLYDQVTTHRWPVTLSFFDSNGWSIKFKNSYVHQSGLFQNPNTDNGSSIDIPGVSNFFVSDLNLSFRFPNRHGMISLGANNLFDNKFNFQNTDYNDVFIAPGRVVFSRITLAF